MQQQQHEQHHRRRRRGNGSGASPNPGATVQPVSQAPKNATEREPQHGQPRAEQKARQPRNNQQRPRTAPPAPAEQSQQAGSAERQQQRHDNRGNRGPRAVTDSAASPQQQQQQQRPPRQQAQQQQQPAKVDEYGNPIRARGKKGAKNTENFVPSHDPPAMRVVVDPHPTESQVRLTTLDVTLHPCVFSQPGDESIYARLVAEIDACTIPQERMLKSWHGDSHWIADDHTGWKKQVPTFTHVVERLQKYFSNSKQKFKINATRLNWYKDSEEWKPFHHDAAAVKPDIARIQNFTVAVSFGVTREAAFEDVLSKRIISFVVPDGSIYTFARDINITWKHGIVQPKPGTHQHHIAQGGRISIIAWGWLDQDEM